jgi:hypothetical protein
VIVEHLKSRQDAVLKSAVQRAVKIIRHAA